MALTTNTALAQLQPSGIRRITAFAKQTPGCILLTLGEPDGNTADVVKEEVAKSIRPIMARWNCVVRLRPTWKSATLPMVKTKSS